jgi:alpha-1,3-mannosyltransferase
MTATSYRIHSVFVLRLFNDPVAMVILYASVAAMLQDHWLAGCILFSAAVSVKMNVLLFAPGLLVVLLARHGPVRTGPYLAACATLQVAVAVPFLRCNPWSYMTRAFDFGRVFMYKWTGVCSAALTVIRGPRSEV